MAVYYVVVVAVIGAAVVIVIVIVVVVVVVGAALLVGRSQDRFSVVSRGDFFRGTPDRTMCAEVDTDSESEYQGFLLG